MCLFEKLICKKKKKKRVDFKIDPNFFFWGQNAIIIIVKNKK